MKKNSTPKKFLIFQEMELFGYKIKKFLIIQETKLFSFKIKNFLIFQETELFGSKTKKFPIFREMELLSPSLKNKKTRSENISYIFIKKAFLIFQETELSYVVSKKMFLYFRKWNFLALYFSYISGNNFPSSKNEKKNTLKKLLIFQEMELSSPKLKKLLFFLKRTP